VDVCTINTTQKRGKSQLCLRKYAVDFLFDLPRQSEMQAERVKINKHFFGNIKRGRATARSISQMGSDSGSDCNSNIYIKCIA